MNYPHPKPYPHPRLGRIYMFVPQYRRMDFSGIKFGREPFLFLMIGENRTGRTFRTIHEQRELGVSNHIVDSLDHKRFPGISQETMNRLDTLHRAIIANASLLNTQSQPRSRHLSGAGMDFWNMPIDMHFDLGRNLKRSPWYKRAWSRIDNFLFPMDPDTASRRLAVMIAVVGIAYLGLMICLGWIRPS